MMLGESDYRLGGLDRLNEAGMLLTHGQFAGSVYLGGRAMESLLRAVIWRHDPEIRAGRKSLETGHNLRDLLTLVANLGVLSSSAHRDELAANVQHVSRLWFNNMRFISTDKMEQHWRRLGELDVRRTLKRASNEYYDACSAVIKRCEVLCRV